MSSPNNTHTPEVTPAPPVPPPTHEAIGEQVDSSAQFAHELANLLDGGLRNVGLVIHSLRDATHEPTGDDDDMARRLETVSHAMQQMGGLLKRWMKDGHEPQQLYEQQLTLGETIEQIVQLLSPIAFMSGVELEWHVSSAAAKLPAGHVYPVIANAVRNSIEAIGMLPMGHVDITANVDGENVVITVTDNGPGFDSLMFDASGNLKVGVTTKPTGHGLGLTLCQNVAASLGGELQVRNTQPQGAELTLWYPIKNVGHTHDG